VAELVIFHIVVFCGILLYGLCLIKAVLNGGGSISSWWVLDWGMSRVLFAV
jgi:hypothetical protein